jgi:hypothetical protein
MCITSQSLAAQQDRIINRDTTSNGSGNPNFCSNSHLSATELKRMRRYQNNKLFGFHKLQGLANGDDARLEELFNKMQSRGYTAVALAELTKTSTAPSPLASASSPTHTYPIAVYSPTDPLARAMLYIPEKYAAVVFKGLVCRPCH